MRLKPNEPGLERRLRHNRLGLGPGYTVKSLTADASSTLCVTNLTSVIYPESVRPSRYEMGRWLGNRNALGYLITNSHYQLNSGTVAAVMLGHISDERNYHELMRSHTIIPADRQDEFAYYNCEKNRESATLMIAGALPGDPNADQLRERLADLAFYLAFEGRFREIVARVWNFDKMLPILESRGFTRIFISDGKYENGDDMVVLGKDAVTFKEYHSSLCGLLGADWVSNYLGIPARRGR